jgi:hypothetical protein
MGDIIPQDIDSTKAQVAPDARICPKCSSAQRTRRIPRSLWIRLIPSSLNMMRGHCGHQFWLVN